MRGERDARPATAVLGRHEARIARREGVSCPVCGSALSRDDLDRQLADARRRYVYCGSEECRAAVRNVLRRVAPETRSCDECGDAFTPARADAKFCSNACRQRAYRRRRETPHDVATTGVQLGEPRRSLWDGARGWLGRRSRRPAEIEHGEP